MRRVHLFAAVAVLGLALVLVVVRAASRQALGVWADLPGGAGVALEVAPGTTRAGLARRLAQAGVVDDADRLLDWIARRAPGLCEPAPGQLVIAAETTPRELVAQLQARCAQPPPLAAP